jgi:hypothetical protein
VARLLPPGEALREVAVLDALQVLEGMLVHAADVVAAVDHIERLVGPALGPATGPVVPVPEVILDFENPHPAELWNERRVAVVIAPGANLLTVVAGFLALPLLLEVADHVVVVPTDRVEW